MATAKEIARMRERAERRLTVAVHTIGNLVGVSEMRLTQHNRDADYLHATRLEELANWLEQVAGNLIVQNSGSGFVGVLDMNTLTGSNIYHSATDDDLKTQAERDGIDPTLSRGDLITALSAKRMEEIPTWLKPTDPGQVITGVEQTTPGLYGLLADDELRLIADHRGIAETNPPMDRETLIRNLEAPNQESAPDGTETASAQASKVETADLPAVLAQAADLEAMTMPELRELAQSSYGVNLAGLKTKAQVIDAIQAASGMTEAQQAAADGVDFEEGGGDADANSG